MGYIQHSDFEDGKLFLEIKLDPNYRKIKSLIEKELKNVEFIKKLDI